MDVPESENGAVLVSFALVFVLATLAFGTTVSGHVALLQSGGVNATVQETDLSGETTTVTVAVTNPTVEPIRVVGARLQVVADGDRIGESDPVLERAVTIPPGTTRTVPITLKFSDRVRPTAATRIAGTLQYRIGQRRLTVDVIARV
ncbi:MAG: hypothetical protein ABEJ77_06685 [Halanaeroarchaeum sp.]